MVFSSVNWIPIYKYEAVVDGTHNITPTMTSTHPTAAYLKFLSETCFPHEKNKTTPEALAAMVRAVNTYERNTADDGNDFADTDPSELSKLLPPGSATRESFDEDPEDFWGTTEGTALGRAIRTNPHTLTMLCGCIDSYPACLEHYTTASTDLPIGIHCCEDYIYPVCDKCNHSAENCGVAGCRTAQDYLDQDCPHCKEIGQEMVNKLKPLIAPGAPCRPKRPARALDEPARRVRLCFDSCA